MPETARILILEPFYGYHYKKMIDAIVANVRSKRYKLITMNATHKYWRSRTSALFFAIQIPKPQTFSTLICSSLVPLAELIGIRPDLVSLTKIVYFHENQLSGPEDELRQREYQFGFNEILTCMAATKVLFSSIYTRDSFLSRVDEYLEYQPDYHVQGVADFIRNKSIVVYAPLDLTRIDRCPWNRMVRPPDTLHIIWAHRWQFDYDPTDMLTVLGWMFQRHYNIKLTIVTQTPHHLYSDIVSGVSCLNAQVVIIRNAIHYCEILHNADVIVSTAKNEFFGSVLLEAAYCGCIPVVPKRFSYNELYEGRSREMYNTLEDLFYMLVGLCEAKSSGILSRDYKHLAEPFRAKRWAAEFWALVSSIATMNTNQ